MSGAPIIIALALVGLVVAAPEPPALADPLDVSDCESACRDCERSCRGRPVSCDQGCSASMSGCCTAFGKKPPGPSTSCACN